MPQALLLLRVADWVVLVHTPEQARAGWRGWWGGVLGAHALCRTHVAWVDCRSVPLDTLANARRALAAKVRPRRASSVAENGCLAADAGEIPRRCLATVRWSACGAWWRLF